MDKNDYDNALKYLYNQKKYYLKQLDAIELLLSLLVKKV